MSRVSNLAKILKKSRPWAKFYVFLSNAQGVYAGLSPLMPAMLSWEDRTIFHNILIHPAGQLGAVPHCTLCWPLTRPQKTKDDRNCSTFVSDVIENVCAHIEIAVTCLIVNFSAV